MHLFLKISIGMANILDPDQTAPSGAVRSGSALFEYALCQSLWFFEILGHLSYLNTLCEYLQICRLCLHMCQTDPIVITVL